MLALSGRRGNGSWLYPGRISNSLIALADVRFGARNAPSARRRPSRATCGLRTRDRSKMISGRERIPSLSALNRGKRVEGQSLRFFRAKELLRKLACKLDQDPVGPALRVPEQGHDDVAVAEVEDCLRTVPREAS